jgi:hypothetical protein
LVTLDGDKKAMVGLEERQTLVGQAEGLRKAISDIFEFSNSLSFVDKFNSIQFISARSFRS